VRVLTSGAHPLTLLLCARNVTTAKTTTGTDHDPDHVTMMTTETMAAAADGTTNLPAMDFSYTSQIRGPYRVD